MGSHAKHELLDINIDTATIARWLWWGMKVQEAGPDPSSGERSEWANGITSLWENITEGHPWEPVTSTSSDGFGPLYTAEDFAEALRAFVSAGCSAEDFAEMLSVWADAGYSINEMG